MSRNFAVSLGALAMALVVTRGVVRGELAGRVASESIVAMLIFAVIGFIAGWIADYLVQDSIERNFRTRVDWYRQGLTNTEKTEKESQRG